MGIKGASEQAKAKEFINAIKTLNLNMLIKEKLDMIAEKDIPQMATNAFHEANPLYPVPKILKLYDISNLFYLIKG